MKQTPNIPIIRRFLSSTRKRTAKWLWPKGRGIVRRENILYLLNLNSDNWVDKELLLWGALDRPQRAFLIDHIRRRQCDMFLDIGANFGIYAACIAKETDCAAIVAYEPDRRAYDKLRTHLLINGLSEKIETRNVAVSGHNGSVPFIYGQDNNDSSSRVGMEVKGTSSVPAVRLDDEWPVKDRRIAIKIDIEGHEMDMLEGAKSLLHNNDCFLQVECWTQNAERFIAAMKAEGHECLHRIGDDHYFARIQL